MIAIRPRSIVCCGIGILSLLLMLSGCMYAQVKNLPPDAQAEFQIYRKVMNAPQTRAYLSKATAAERDAYLAEIGIAQRFEALDDQDRDAVQAGYIRKGMSAEALRFLWGRPTRTAGHTGRYEHWYYYGSVPTLVAKGSQRQDAGTLVDVYLVDSQVEWWLETVPPNIDKDDDASDRTRF